jgi:hypothetical protein
VKSVIVLYLINAVSESQTGCSEYGDAVDVSRIMACAHPPDCA